jgi:hypothetical protein
MCGHRSKYIECTPDKELGVVTSLVTLSPIQFGVTNPVHAFYSRFG